MSFNNRPCKFCGKGIQEPSKFQKVCDACKIKHAKIRLKGLRTMWKRDTNGNLDYYYVLRKEKRKKTKRRRQTKIEMKGG